MTLELVYEPDLPEGSVIVGSVSAIKYLDEDGDEAYAIRHTGLPIMERTGLAHWAANMADEFLSDVSASTDPSEDP